MAAGESVLDEGLFRARPVEGGVDLAHRGGAEAERLAEGMAGGGRVEHTGGGEFGGQVEQSGDDQRENQVAATLERTAGQRAIETDAAGRGQSGEHMAMRQGAADLETALAGGHEFVAAQSGTERLDFLAGPG